MDGIHVFLNLIAPFIIIFSIIVLLPPVLLFKLLFYCYRCTFPENLAGKVVLITGASSGIGQHVAYEYAKRGACLVLCDRIGNKLQNVAHATLDLGSPDVITICADVSMIHECKRIVEEAIHHFGKLDHLVNNAGITNVCEFENCVDAITSHQIMDTNFWGSVYTIHNAIPYLKKSNGKIIVISSVVAWFPFPGMTIYNASKAALISLYETLRVEVGGNIGITVVTPGLIESEITRGKHLLDESKKSLVPKLSDDVFRKLPVESVKDCASAIVKSAIRGDKYLTEPAWVLVSYYWNVFFPEINEWLGRVIVWVVHNGSIMNTISNNIFVVRMLITMRHYNYD